MCHRPALCIEYERIVSIVFILTTALLIDSIGAICPESNWWDQTRDSCIPCTTCEDQSIVLRPCQLHQDTLCGTLQDLEIDWSFLGDAQKRVVVPEWDETVKASNLDQQSQTAHDIMWLWDWQAASLAIAAISCVLFFIVAACIFWQHTRYWKKMERMERGFNADAEELSTRLMHTIIDIRNDENGRVILEEARKDQIVNPFELRCVYLEQLIDGNEKAIVTKPLVKNNDRNRKEKIPPQAMPIKNLSEKEDEKHPKGRGNCYIEPTQQRDNCVVSELYLIT